MLTNLLKSIESQKIIGARQTLKAVEKGIAQIVYIAEDADSRIVNPIYDLCIKNGLAVERIATMQELGNACGISIGAAAATVRK